jgi:hypothetical protein
MSKTCKMQSSLQNPNFLMHNGCEYRSNVLHGYSTVNILLLHVISFKEQLLSYSMLAKPGTRLNEK